MNTKRAVQAFAILASCSLIFAACTKKTNPEGPAQQAAAPAPASAPAAAPIPANAKPDTEVTIGTQGNNMAFEKTEFTVKAGQIVKVTLKNNATADSNLEHNLVITQPGQAEAVASASMSAGEAKNWVAEGPNVVAHTQLTKPGTTQSVVFRAPAKAGDYPFECTFPGHSAMMKGTMKVQ